MWYEHAIRVMCINLINGELTVGMHDIVMFINRISWNTKNANHCSTSGTILRLRIYAEVNIHKTDIARRPEDPHSVHNIIHWLASLNRRWHARPRSLPYVCASTTSSWIARLIFFQPEENLPTTRITAALLLHVPAQPHSQCRALCDYSR